MIEFPDEKESAPTEFALDLTPPIPDMAFVERLRYAHEHGGAGYFKIVSEIAVASWNKRLGALDYLMFELWNKDFDKDIQHTFIGQQVIRDFMTHVGLAWETMAEDKILMMALLRGFEFPTPETQAVYHTWRPVSGAIPLRTGEDMARFLRDDARYPMFCKPVSAQMSLGTASILSYDRDRDLLIFSGNRELSVDGFVAQVLGMADLDEDTRRIMKPGAGYLFQSTLRTHPELQRLLGSDAVSGVRCIVVVDKEGPHLHRAVWKVVGGSNSADNVWRDGNLAAALNPETGAVVHAKDFLRDHIEPVEEHPDTGLPFDGMVFPEWEAVRKLALDAAAAIPDCLVQGWDIVLCEQGPVILEVQAGGGSPVLSQMGFSTGLYQGRYKKVVDAVMSRDEARKRIKKRQRKKHRERLIKELKG